MKVARSDAGLSDRFFEQVPPIFVLKPAKMGRLLPIDGL